MAFTDPGADLSSLHVSLVDVRVPRYSYPIKVFEGDVVRQLLVFLKIRVGRYSAVHPFLLYMKERIPVLVGADLLYQCAQCAEDPLSPEEVFARVVGGDPISRKRTIEREGEKGGRQHQKVPVQQEPLRGLETCVGDTVSVLCAAEESTREGFKKERNGQYVIQGPLEEFQHPKLVHVN